MEGQTSTTVEPIVQEYQGKRITYHTQGKASTFANVIQKLYSAIGHPSEAKFLEIMGCISSMSDKTAAKTRFIEEIQKAVGPFDFMIFQEYNHGAWLPLFDLSGLGLKRIILGNPLIAQTMLQHDSRAGLFVPVEILIQEVAESEGGGTLIIYDLPSSLLANEMFRPEKELVNASMILDGKLKALVEFLVRQ